MNNKRNDSVTEFGGYQWPAVFEYKADDALFVLCETEDDERYHIKLKFDSIVSILTSSGTLNNAESAAAFMPLLS